MAETHSNKGNQGHTQGNANRGGQGHDQHGNQGGNQGQGSQGMAGVAQMAQTAKDAATSATRAAGEQVQHATESVAGGMRSFAGTIREHAPEGMLGTAAGSVADSLESGSRYLEQEGLSGMADDLVTVVRRYPVASMLICAGVGFCLARMLTPNGNSGSY